jgi:ferrous iron transport protein B
MYLTFWLTINFGGCFIDFFDGIFGAVFVDGFGILLEKIGTPIFLKTLLANGIGSGIQTISTFIPPISMMFFCLAILEDSGYMSRAAFVMDRFMRAIGLPGKAFVPMLVGFGCNVPAIMATRTLDEEKDRILTIMMNPFMSCGARIPVYALFATLFFPNTGGNIVFSLYLVGIIVAIITGFLFKKTILKGETSLFIMELPPYHIPTLKSIFLHTWCRLKSFIFRAGKAILIVVIILNLLNSIGIDGSFGNENTKNSILSKIGKSIVPIFKPMGITENNWPATVGIFTGIFAKESVVGTLDSLYTQIENKQNQNKIQEKFDFFKKIKEAFSTIPETLSELNLPFSITGLLGIEIEKQEVKENTLIFMKKYFDGKIGAYAYLLLILLYMPCVAAIAAVYRETNIKWTIFISLYSSALAWLASVLFYQIFTISKHPKSSICWIITIIVVLIFFIGTLHLKSKNLKINKLLQK